MQIKHQLTLAALTPLFLALVVGLAVRFTHGARGSAQEQRNAAARVIRSVNDLSHLLGVYILHQEERPREQFQAEHRALAQWLRTIQFREPEQQALLHAIGENVATMGYLFDRLVAAELASSSGLGEPRLAGQLLVRSRQAVADAIRLEMLATRRTAGIERTVNLILLLLLIALAVPPTLALLRMRGRIAGHLVSVHAGMQAVGAGNLAHRIGLSGTDELAGIAASFDRMTENLQSLTVSRDDLEREVAERRQAEAALRQSEERLRLAKTAASLGIHDYDLASGHIRWDERMRELWGIGPDVPITYELFMAGVHPEDRTGTQAAVNRALDPAGDGVYCAEYRVVNALDGRTRWLAAAGKVTFDAARPLRLVGTVQDITERKAFQAELERLVAERTAKLEELVGELEHFSYSITHDMRAPLRAMKGYSEIVNELCAPCPLLEQKSFLKRIGTSADRMDALIRDALNYSRSVRQELPVEVVDSGALLRGMLDSYPEFQRSRAHIRVEGDLPVVLANEAGLTQCFSNLLGNAVKFVRPGQIPEIRVWAQQEPGWATIWVEDQGIGIAPGMLPRVFDMFSRGQNTYEGTGIGLALVRKVMDRMGGKVGVLSEEGQGSRFWLKLKTAPHLHPLGL